MQTSGDTAASKVIAFLESKDALDTDTVPWGTYLEDEQILQVDYDRLMGDDEEPFGVPQEFAIAIEQALQDIRPEPNAGESIGNRSTTAIEGPWDVCAWYQPIHFFAHDWGIFVREECLMRFAIKIARATSAVDFNVERNEARLRSSSRSPAWQVRSDAELFLRAGFICLFLHEHFHHRVECLGLRLHVVTGTGLYVPYFRGVYFTGKGSDDLLEEALANACVFLRIWENAYRKLLPKSVIEAIRHSLLMTFPFEPPGYRKAVDFLTSAKFNSGENQLQGYVRETSLSPAQPTQEWDVAPRLTQSFFNIKSNIYSVVPMGSRPVLPAIVLPQSCSTDQMIRICRRAGYAINTKGGKGSHIKLEKSGAMPVILPNRKDLSIGVIKNTLTTLGHRLPELPELLNA